MTIGAPASPLGFAPPPRAPLQAVPERALRSVRRTMHVDVGARATWGTALPLSGGARDLVTRDERDSPSVVAQAHVEAGFDPERQLIELQATPDADWVLRLLGVRAGGGFRRRLAEIVPPEDAHALLRQVLDDLPAAMLISGYAFMRLARRQGLEPSSLTPPNVLDHMVDLCSGWRAGGVAARSIGTGAGVPLQDTPQAPHLESAGDRWAWHDTGHLASDHMRRRRCIDVQAQSDGTFEVWAMFRDSVGEPDGSESALHEYVVEARGRGEVLEELRADPRVLPFPECPAAADHVGAMTDVPLELFSSTVPDHIDGIRSCTHLNDLLRALGGVHELLELARQL